MKKRTKVALLLAVVAAVVVVTTSFLLTPASPSARINPRAYGSIKPGMLREEVEQVVGLAPGDYVDLTPRPPQLGYVGLSHWGNTSFLRIAQRKSLPEPDEVIHWWGNDYCIEVSFNTEGRAVGCGVAKLEQPGGSSLVERVKAWAGW